MKRYVLLTMGILVSILIYSQENNNGSKHDDDIGPSDSKYANCVEIADIRDGETYDVVQIGSQCWMSENLRYLPQVTGPNFQWNSIDPEYSVYSYADEANSVDDAKLSDNYLNYSVLYNWFAAVDACPEGWHLPSELEWIILEEQLLNEFSIINEDSADGAGNALKSCRQQNSIQGGECSTDLHPRWNENAINSGVDLVGFSALPGGLRSTTGANHHIGLSAYLWTETEEDELEASRISLSYSTGNIIHEQSSKKSGFSIRCVQNVSGTATLPSVTTKPVLDITQISVRSGGIIGDDGDCSIIEKGILVSETPNPTIFDNIFMSAVGTGSQEFDTELAGLDPGVEYYVRAYAINFVDTAYGQEISFTTLEFANCGQITDVRDGNVYNTVLIGLQCWMAESLKYLPEVTGDDSQWDSEEPRYSVYGYNDVTNSTADAKTLDNYENYGVLYNWYAAQNACPEGWHLPSLIENEILLDHLNSEFGFENINEIDGVGNALKSCRQQYNSYGCSCITEEHPRWWGGNTIHFGTNAVGFYGLPSGYRNTNASFDNIGSTVYFWMTKESESANDRAYSTRLSESSGELSTISNTYKKRGNSVRCIKDTDITATVPSIITSSGAEITQSTVLIGGSDIINGGDPIISVSYTHLRAHET